MSLVEDINRCGLPEFFLLTGDKIKNKVLAPERAARYKQGSSGKTSSF
jgi:hypothetical protein